MIPSTIISRSSLRILQRNFLLSTRQCAARAPRKTARYLSYDVRKAQEQKPQNEQTQNRDERLTENAQKLADSERNQDSKDQQPAAELPQLSSRQKLRQFFKEYGTIGFVVHTSLALTSVSFFYCLVSSGLDVPLLLSKVGIKPDNLGTIASGASTFVIAYACHKVFMPVRIFLTLSLTPVLVRKLRAIGFLKPPAPKL